MVIPYGNHIVYSTKEVLMEEEKFRYFNDDGTEFDPDLMSKPNLCLTCLKDEDSSEEILCNLNRADQKGKKSFICEAYESVSGKK